MSQTQSQLKPEDAALMRSAIQRVATGPELSKNLSYEETRSVMRCILSGDADPVQSAVYLIGLRMKRETDDEVKGVLDALLDATITKQSTVSDVVALSEPYNGFNRTLQGSLMVLPVLAACGVACYSTGVELGGPKFGVTHHTTLRSLGGDPLQSVDQLNDRLANSDIGWGYIDQRVFCPALHDLNGLRSRIVKRPVLSTTEVLLAPLRGADRTHLITGYVHKPYRDVYSMLAKHAGFGSLLLVRGTEGGIIPSFRGRAHVVRYTEKLEQHELDIDLAELDLEREYRAEDIPETMPLADADTSPIGMKWDIHALSDRCAEAATDALNGKAGAVYDAAITGAAMVLWHTGHCEDMSVAVAKARDVVKSGKAKAHFEAGL